MTRFSHVLCPIDLSDISQHVVDHAAAIARWYDERLTLLYVRQPADHGFLPPRIAEPAERDRAAAAMRSAAEHVPAAVKVEFMVQEAESAHEEILRLVPETGADLLVMGISGLGGPGVSAVLPRVGHRKGDTEGGVPDAGRAAASR